MRPTDRLVTWAMADEYERTLMPGVGQVLYRHKVTSPRWLMLLSILVPLVSVSGVGLAMALAGSVVPGLAVAGGGLALGALMAFIMVTFASARLVVSEGEFLLHIGMGGPRIPIDDIEQVSIAPSGRNNIGMGVKMSLDGTKLYTLWGDNARALHLGLRGGKKLIVVSKETDAIKSAIDEARARRARPLPVRVAAASAGDGPRTDSEELDAAHALEPREAERAMRS